MSVLNEPILNTALRYSKLGFATFPLYSVTPQGCNCGDANCNSPGKHPLTVNGLRAASTNPEVLHFQFEGKTANIGLATGPTSNIFVLDIDGAIGESSLSNYPAMPETLTSTTGRGRHLIFRYPDKKVYTRAGKFAPGLDIRGDGGYIVAPPSIHYTGVVYQWLDENTPIAEAPEWLLDIICKAPEAKTAPIPNTPSNSDKCDSDKWTVDEVRELLSFIDPDCGYDEWIQVGMALHDEGMSLAVWDEWSKRGAKYKPGNTVNHWKSFHPSGGISFGTVVHMAALSGWKPREIIDDNTDAKEFIARLRDGGFSVNGVAVNKSVSNNKSDNIAPSTFSPLSIPGLVGDTIREIINTSQKPQPELALLNTLAALGAIFGRRYASPMDTRTNLYTVGTAVTGAGKDHSRRFIKKLMTESQLDTFLGEDTIISGAGLLTSISKRPSQIMHLDEFGMLLEAITDQRGAAHMKAVSKVITEMYSSSGGTFVGGQYADKKAETVNIPYPNLCLFGTTTPEKYASSLSRSAISSGELNRFLVLRPIIERPERRRYMGAASPSDQLTAQWRSLIDHPPLNHSTFTPEVITVSWTGLEDRVWDMGLYEDAQIAENVTTGALWSRYRENVIKIAMILSICRNTTVPIITNNDFDIAEAIVSQAILYATDLAENHMADSEHERDCQDIISAIRKHTECTRTLLYRSTQRMNTKQRDDALKSLLEQERISIDKITGQSNKPITIYRVL